MATSVSATNEHGTIPAVVRRHRRQKQLDWAITFVHDAWRPTPAGWRLSETDYELFPTGDKVRDHGYRVLKSGIPCASFASPHEAIAYVSWRAAQKELGFGATSTP